MYLEEHFNEQRMNDEIFVPPLDNFFFYFLKICLPIFYFRENYTY